MKKTRLNWGARLMKLFVAGIIVFLLILLLIAYAEWRVRGAVDEAGMYEDVEAIPARRTGLVLGTVAKLMDGRPNLFFTYRIQAAAELFHAGKVEFLLLSGDNSKRGYDEPDDMFDALREQGVPAERMILDCAGFRTLDSVVRAKEVFGLESCTIISQPFHNARAVFLAREQGVDAIGYNARDVRGAAGARMWGRERLARTKAVLDVWTGKGPRFLGERIEVSEANAGRVNPQPTNR